MVFLKEIAAFFSERIEQFYKLFHYIYLTSHLKVFWDIQTATFPKKLCGRFANFQTGPFINKTSYTAYYLC